MKFRPATVTGMNNPIPQYFKDLFPGIDNPLDCPLCGHDVEISGMIDTPPIAAQMYAMQHHGEWKWSARRCFCPHCHNMFDIVDEHLLGLP